MLRIRFKNYLILGAILSIILIINNADFVIGQTVSSANYNDNSEIKRLNNDIQDKKNQTKTLEEKQQKYSDAIQKKQSEKASLNNQLAILDNRVAKAELDIEKVELDIDKIELEIEKTNISIEEQNKQINNEKSHIENVLQLIHEQDNVSSLEVMLSSNSLSDFLSQSKYLEDVNENIKQSLDALEKLKRSLERENENLVTKNKDMHQFRKELDERKKALASEKDNKSNILSQVNQSESEYQRLLAAAKKEQEDAAAEIASMEKLVRAKIASLEGEDPGFNDNGFIWPVTKNTITTYFHDPDYPFRYIFEHPAIDIRAAQGSPIKATASGYVARAKDAGKGYSYIMIIHGDGLSSVYGHVSKIYVKEDDYVIQGQTIGLSGGLPGTNGAGSLTTGPHLHFEIRLNGIPVDPLSYLP